MDIRGYIVENNNERTAFEILKGLVNNATLKYFNNGGWIMSAIALKKGLTDEKINKAFEIASGYNDLSPMEVKTDIQNALDILNDLLRDTSFALIVDYIADDTVDELINGIVLPSEPMPEDL